MILIWNRNPRSSRSAECCSDNRPKMPCPGVLCRDSQEVRSYVGRRDPIVELISAMTDALARNDEGDMDCPAWENMLRIEPLRAQLRLLSHGSADVSKASATASAARLEGIAAS